MRILLNIAVVIALALSFAIFGSYGRGQVIILLSHYRIELSLFFAILILLMGFTILYYAIRLSINLGRIPRKIRRWRLKRAEIKSQQELTDAMLNYFEGRYNLALKHANGSINPTQSTNSKFLAQIIMFKSLSYMRLLDKKREMQKQLLTYSQKKFSLILSMIKSKIYYFENNENAALDTLYEVINIDPDNIEARRLLLNVYVRLNDYEKGFSALQWLIQHEKMIEIYERHKLHIISGLFDNQSNISSLRSYYNQLSESDQQNLIINTIYLRNLIRLKDFDHGLTIFENLMLKEITASVGQILLGFSYGLKNKAELERFYKHTKSLATKDNTHQVELALGIVCYKLQDYANAKAHLDASIVKQTTIDASLYLLLIANHSNDSNQTNRAIQQLSHNLDKLMS